jgi:hypothetical protein
MALRNWAPISRHAFSSSAVLVHTATRSPAFRKLHKRSMRYQTFATRGLKDSK